jgi:hypothetical protein
MAAGGPPITLGNMPRMACGRTMCRAGVRTAILSNMRYPLVDCFLLIGSPRCQSPFSSERELIDYANWFLRDRANAFRKDIEICLTANSDRQHAYFPALITCIAFLDPLSAVRRQN